MTAVSLDNGKMCGGGALPWCISYLRLTYAIAFKLASSVVFYSPTELLMKVISALLALHSGKHSRIHLCSIESQTCS